MSACRTGISISGGIGKTALAVGYVATYGAQYKLIAWVDAERPALVPAQYRHMLRNHTGKDLVEADAVASTKALLADMEDWLIIYDNAASPEDLEPYIPAGAGKVLVTTRNDAWSVNSDLLFELDTLSDESVASWVNAAVPESDPVAVQGLVTRLGGLPLAVVQALSFIGVRPGETIATYLTRLETKEGQQEAFSRFPPNYPRSLATTWNVTHDVLVDQNPLAVAVLEYLAYLDPNGVALHLLDGGDVLGDLSRELEALRSYGLVRTSSKSVRVHRLLQDVVRWSLDAKHEIKRVKEIVRHFRYIAPDSTEQSGWDWYADVRSQVLSLADHAARLDFHHPALAGLATQTGIAFAVQGSMISAVVMFERALAIMEGQHGPHHSRVVEPLTNLGTAHYQRGEYAESLKINERALQIVQRKRWRNRIELANILNNIGNAHLRLGHTELAIELYQRALNIFEKSRWLHKDDLARTLDFLGFAYQELGDFERAAELCQRGLGLAEDIYPPDHPNLIRGLDFLGIARRRLGDPAHAVDLHVRALRIGEKAYGHDNPGVAVTLRNLGVARRDLSQHVLAMELLERSLHIFEIKYGLTHPDVARTLVHLGLVHQDVGEEDIAIQLLGRASQIFEKSFGAEHPDTIRTQNALGRSY